MEQSEENKKEKSDDIEARNDNEEQKESETPPTKVEEIKEKSSEEKVEDVESIRRVIKVGSEGESPQEDVNANEEMKVEKEPKEKEESNVKNNSIDNTNQTSSDTKTGRETLEQKRAILQSIKDFDFQIKKNQEDLGKVSDRVDSLTKDLDDLVSLYEIVSEQMNPFVGLSKVTKKRIDALESFTKEIDLLKTRMGDIESFAEQAGTQIQSHEVNLMRETDDDPSVVEEKEIDAPIEEKENQTPKEKQQKQDEKNTNDDEINKIIDVSFESMSLDKKIDTTIDDFIEKLLGE